jgi:branched-chain amino acid transport system substrate-binding protein
MWFSKRFLLLALCLLGMGYISGCAEKDPLRIGVALELTGREADLGVQTRNGISLAVDAVNQTGGINEQLIELEVKDDQGNPETAQQVDRELIDKGVAAILGHVTSQQSLAGLTVTRPAGVVLFSATATSTELTGKNDLFFRVIGDNAHDSCALAGYILKDFGIQKVAVVYDEDNASYSRTFVDSFESAFTQQGGVITTIVDFSNTEQPDFTPILKQVQASNPQGLVLVASAANTAFLVQKARLLEWDIPIFSSTWAFSETFLQNGGLAIEGVEMVTPYDVSNYSPAMEQFRQKYKDAFGTEPNFGAAQGYEAAMVLVEAIKRSGGDMNNLPDALRSIQGFDGLSGTISIDPYGDVIRSLYLTRVVNGQWVTVKSLTVP